MSELLWLKRVRGLVCDTVELRMRGPRTEGGGEDGPEGRLMVELELEGELAP